MYFHKYLWFNNMFQKREINIAHNYKKIEYGNTLNH